MTMKVYNIVAFLVALTLISGNVKIPCWLQPEKHYVGAAWYQRDIDIPTEWKDKHLDLFWSDAIGSPMCGLMINI